MKRNLEKIRGKKVGLRRWHSEASEVPIK